MARFLAILATLLFNIAYAERHISITALTGKNNVSVLECWQLSAPLADDDRFHAPDVKTLNMGSVSNATYITTPPGWKYGPHNAPYKQWVWIMNGMMELTLPNKSDTATIYGGKYGLIFADDTEDISGWGHETNFLGDSEMVMVMIPVRDNVAPAHSVVNSGPCVMDEQIEMLDLRRV